MHKKHLITIVLLGVLLLSVNLFAVDGKKIVLNSSQQNMVDIEVISSNDNEIEIEYQINSFYKKDEKINNSDYSHITIPHEGIYLDKGYPSIPKINRSVLIPAFAKMEAEIVEIESKIFKNINVVPSKGNLTRNINPEDVPYEFSEFYSEDKWFPQNIVNTGSPYLIRDARGLVININPFQYNPKKEVLKVHQKVRVLIKNVGTSNVNTADMDLSQKKALIPSFRSIYENHFINFEQSRYPVLSEVGSMLIITYDDFYSAVEPLYDWKRQKGVPTEIVNVSTIGNNSASIKSYIQNKYDTDGVTFILLVGDAAQVAPCDSNQDPRYTLLAGSDNYPDAFVGRFSAENTTQVETQVNKVLSYESDPFFGGDWLHKGMGVASNQGTGYNGWYDNEMMDIIRDTLMDYTYTEVDQIYDPSASPSDVSTAINAGRSIGNYCGHGSTTSWGSSGFSNTHVNALTNENMWPYILSVACVNGNFTGTTCFAEAWLRATHNTTGEPTGAIAMYASTINQSWTPPMQAEYHTNMLLKDEVKNTIGGLYFSGSMFMIDLSGTNGFDEFEHWTIFGDPSLQVRTDTPSAMTVNHNSIIPLGSTTYDVEIPGVEDALVGLFMDNTLYGYGYTDAGGNVTIDIIEPLNDPGTMTVTATAYNKIPYSTNIDAIVPVQVSFSPDVVDANTETDVTVTVMDSDGNNPEVGVDVWADGLGYETDPVSTDSNGEAVITIDYPFGPELNIKGQRPDDDYQLFDETLAVNATALTNPDLNVTTYFGMIDTFGMNLPGTIHKNVGEDDTQLWACNNEQDFINTMQDTLEMTPDETGHVSAIITKSGYDMYEENFSVKVAYGTVSGFVTDSDNGAPVTNAVVRFYNEGGDPTGEPLFSANTNSSGEYSVTEPYPVDHYDIYIDKWGFSPYQEMEYFLGYDENSHNITIDPVESGLVTGKLVDNFFVIGEGTLTYYRTDNGEQYASVDIIDDAYSVSLPYFTYEVYVSAPGHVPFSGTLTIDGDREIDYHLGNAAMYNDFENDNGDFSSNNPSGWQWGEPTAGGINAYSGVNVWGTVLDGEYENYADWTLQSSSFTVPSSGMFTFYHYHDFEGGYSLYDGGNVKISTDGGSTFNLITPESGYDGNIVALDNEQGFSGTLDNWEQVEFDLTNYAGETAIIMWHFGSDSYVNSYYGWYIDNVLVGNPDASYQVDIMDTNNEPQAQKLNLGQNYPNPVSGSTTISFALPRDTENAELRIYNILGQLVKKYIPDSKSAGKFDYTWNGTDMNGKEVSNGIYFYRLSTEKKNITKKMILVK